MRFPFLALMILFGSTAYSQSVELTFQVDMRKTPVSPNGVHVAGNFQSEAGYPGDWDPSTTMLSDTNGDTVYSITVEVPPGVYLYKFINGSSWGEQPELPSEFCAKNDGAGNLNREVIVGELGVTLPVVEFDSCNPVLHFAVNMKDETVSGAGVHVFGDFQEAAGYGANYDPSSIPLIDANGDGTYEADIPVQAGSYRYRFVNGDDSMAAETPDAVCTTAGWRTVQAEVSGEQLPIYCFNTCEVCDPAIDTSYATYWWNEAVFYEIFVRSFYDSDGDGIGDFQGMIEKLDYLNDGDPHTTNDLGITGIWLMPMMSSPSYHGYDVVDYYSVEPDYGTMADFEEFLDSAHARGIRVIIDYVMNHTSSQNPWFSQSANDENGFRDWYVWSDTDPGYIGPWGQQVWHSLNGEYYYGLFWGGMPDLNYEHPAVKQEMFDIAEFWLEKGVDGFRLDAIKYLDEDSSILEDTPETFALLEEFNDVYKAANPEALTVGEVWSNTVSVVPYIQNDRIDVCFEFDLASAILTSTFYQDPSVLLGQMDVVQTAYPRLQYATFLTNHDIDRVFSQLNGNIQMMKQAAVLYLTLPGVPFIYYGEEVGMTGTGAHENIRRPMQWSGGAQAGFSSGTPWTGLGNNYSSYNVEDMSADEGSILNLYRSLVQARAKWAPLRKGYYLPLETGDVQLLGYARVYRDEMAIVVSNMTGAAALPIIDLTASSMVGGVYNAIELLSSTELGTVEVNENGGLSAWQPFDEAMEFRESAVIILTEKDPIGIEEDLIVNESFRLFPNPVQETLSIELNGNSDQPLSVEILDASGRVVLQSTEFSHPYRIDVSGLGNGAYFVRCTTGDSTAGRAFVIAR